MPDLPRIKARIGSLEELRDLFSAMQAMAASRVQSAQAALSGIRNYTEVIERAIAKASALQPASVNFEAAGMQPPSGMLVVICSEHGFAGAFNRLLLEHAKSEVLPGEAIAIVGLRGASLAPEHGIEIAWSSSMATRPDGVLASARRVTSKLGEVDRVRVAFSQYGGGTRSRIEIRQVIPPDPRILEPSRNGQLPMHHLEPQRLLRDLINELLLAELMRAMMESFASENAARLQIMQSANHNISDKLGILTRDARQLRQESITSELLEVVAGGEAVLRSEVDPAG